MPLLLLYPRRTSSFGCRYPNLCLEDFTNASRTGRCGIHRKVLVKGRSLNAKNERFEESLCFSFSSSPSFSSSSVVSFSLSLSSSLFCWAIVFSFSWLSKIKTTSKSMIQRCQQQKDYSKFCDWWTLVKPCLGNVFFKLLLAGFTHKSVRNQNDMFKE